MARGLTGATQPVTNFRSWQVEGQDSWSSVSTSTRSDKTGYTLEVALQHGVPRANALELRRRDLWRHSRRSRTRLKRAKTIADVRGLLIGLELEGLYFGSNSEVTSPIHLVSNSPLDLENDPQMITAYQSLVQRAI